MRRTVTVPKTLLLAALLMAMLPTALPARAQEAEVVSIVTGLAPDDLLNIRAKPSPGGKIQARLPNGSSLNNLGCNDVNGHQWCKVAMTDNPQMMGWAPARYLSSTNPQPVADMETTGEGATMAAGAANPALAAPLPDLTERLGGTDAETPPTPAEAIGKAAIEDAYRLALSGNGDPPTGETDGQAPAAGANQNFAVNAAPPADAQTVARLQPPGPPAAGAKNRIPCARYVGQPMTSCDVSIVRQGDSKAAVTVTWPDGGTRVISFAAGLPAGSDASGEFRFTREGTLNMIRVGVSERFEIPDALATGG
ncbi:SH3 domain-containing protein [Mesorhizobium helmanticense]|uniref:SH3 domain-containing protein n=1 Tax=Mesorhizobium helmanticense TaxID=1776423 RepID=A0A2T4IWE0_9HYPH|nr:SH3 domain-containing protein [Mesorhizobium helmanticense]PTE09942.1 SH3 domain-containing protein [Mesorhizobium helmanticense]